MSETLQGLDREQAQHLYRQMLLIRRFEERAAQDYAYQKIGGFLHLYIGEEAVAVGAISVLRPDDYVVGHYRDHGHALAKGCDPKRVMAELYGKATGLCKGKGGSMHLFDAEHGMLGGYAIVAGGMPIAAGHALASAYLGDGRVTLDFLGDGAANEGEFHETLNLAALWKLPMAFIIENNFYAMGTRVDRASAEPQLWKRAAAYGMPGKQIDGMDVLEVRAAAAEAVQRARAGEGPSLVEAMTYRFRGHSMADPTQYRAKAEEQEWKARDPILHFEQALRAAHLLTDQELADLARSVEDQVREAAEFADQSPFPAPAALYEDIYVES
jgi:pyruvate dehydrogenase E1 component alpha subunit